LRPGSWNTTSVAYRNNLITNSKLGLAVWTYEGDQAVVTHSGNRFSGNQANYAGLAQPD
jgi:hypothetical protein